MNGDDLNDEDIFGRACYTEHLNDHKADQANDNKGTSGTNEAYQKMLDYRSKQLNPNNDLYKGKKGENK